MGIYPVGCKVLVVEDIREGSPATGKTGIYEGDFPLTAIVKYNGETREVDYEPFVKAVWSKMIPFWERGKPKPEGNYWFEIDNPRIRLEDGSTIWGAECWWQPDENQELPEAVACLARHKAMLQELAEELAKKKQEVKE